MSDRAPTRGRSAGPFGGIWLGAAVLGLILAAGCGRHESRQEVPSAFRGPLLGEPMPRLSVREWLIPRSSARERRARVVLFWNYGDPLSSSAMRFAESLAREHGGRLEVITIHSEIGLEEFQSVDGVRNFLSETGASLPTAIDSGSESLVRSRILEVPGMLFVDDREIVRGMLTNYRESREPDIEEFVQSLL